MNKKKYIFLMLFILFASLLTFSIVNIFGAFAIKQPGESVILTSFEEEYVEPGDWKLEKSAKWLKRGVAEIEFNLNTIFKNKESNNKLDVIFVTDVSSSMYGNKINKLKEDSISMIERILSDRDNRIGLIKFSSESSILSNLSNNKDELVNIINNLQPESNTNYYRAFVNIDKILENYSKENNRDCIVVFLSDGLPNEETPNEISFYKVIKEKYPFIKFKSIQYSMGNELLDLFKVISDEQYVANTDDLSIILPNAVSSGVTYDKFVVTDFINSEYFSIGSIEDIKASIGEVYLDGNRVKWVMNDILSSGNSAKLTIKIRLKDAYSDFSGLIPTNTSEEVESLIDGESEHITTTESPVLPGKIKVYYDSNLPIGCSEVEVPEEAFYYPYSVVRKSSSTLKCDGYSFKEWYVKDSVNVINSDYFSLYDNDVKIVAIWSKLDIKKSLNGSIAPKDINYLMVQPYTINNGKSYRKSNNVLGKEINPNLFESITIVDTNEVPSGVIDSWDVSEKRNHSIMAWYTDADGNNYYELYIGQDGGVIANEDSSLLFGTDVYNPNSGFKNVSSIDLANLNTSYVINMSQMFAGLNKLDNINVSHFDTSKVTNMDSLFSMDNNLTTLNLSNFDTENVTSMNYMFFRCSKLKSLNLESFDTKNVTSFINMFCNCSNLEALNLSHFNTEKARNMYGMFTSCSKLQTLDLGNFNTENVTTMTNMFRNCTNLVNINADNFTGENLAEVQEMFSNNSSLENIDIRMLDISNVTNKSRMFASSPNIKTIIVKNEENKNMLTTDTELVDNVEFIIQGE